MRYATLARASLSPQCHRRCGEIVEKLDELEQHPEALDVGTDSFDDADDDAAMTGGADEAP